jgi:hypothetical protein
VSIVDRLRLAALRQPDGRLAVAPQLPCDVSVAEAHRGIEELRKHASLGAPPFRTEELLRYFVHAATERSRGQVELSEPISEGHTVLDAIREAAEELRPGTPWPSFRVYDGKGEFAGFESRSLREAAGYADARAGHGVRMEWAPDSSRLLTARALEELRGGREAEALVALEVALAVWTPSRGGRESGVHAATKEKPTAMGEPEVPKVKVEVQPPTVGTGSEVKGNAPRRRRTSPEWRAWSPRLGAPKAGPVQEAVGPVGGKADGIAKVKALIERAKPSGDPGRDR